LAQKFEYQVGFRLWHGGDLIPDQEKYSASCRPYESDSQYHSSQSHEVPTSDFT
jgi:hypothetical protein